MTKIPSDGDVIVVWFSCGAASAVAWEQTLLRYGDRCDVRAVNNPVVEEDSDNERFGEDVARWLGRSCVRWAASDYPSASAREVWERRKAMSFPKGAPCTTHLKKVARQEYETVHHVDWHVLGFTADERHRYERFILTERDNVLPVLIDAGLTKQDCADRLVAAGVALPRMYGLGYPNANCVGCVKATSPTYWNLVRQTHPEVFEERAQQSRALGAKLVRVANKRMFLDELDPSARGRPLKNMTVECGVFCEETKR